MLYLTHYVTVNLSLGDAVSNFTWLLCASKYNIHLFAKYWRFVATGAVDMGFKKFIVVFTKKLKILKSPNFRFFRN